MLDYLEQTKNVALYYLSGLQRNPYRIFGIFFVPILDVFIFYFLVVSISNNAEWISNFAFALISTLVFWSFLSRIINSISGEIIDDATSKSIRNLVLSPISDMQLAFGLLISAIIKVFLVLVVLFLLSLILFGQIPIYAVAAYWLLILAIFGWSVGLMLSGLVFLYGERVGVLGMFANVLIQPFSCVFYSREVLPEPIKAISFLFPSSYVFESIRDFIQYGSASNLNLGLLISILYCFFAIGFFKWAVQRSKYTGMITKI